MTFSWGCEKEMKVALHEVVPCFSALPTHILTAQGTETMADVLAAAESWCCGALVVCGLPSNNIHSSLLRFDCPIALFRMLS